MVEVLAAELAPEVAVAEVVVVLPWVIVETGALPSSWYTVRRLPAPQSSLELPGQVIEQSVSAVTTEPSPKKLPQ